MNELTPRYNIETICENYNQALREVESGLGLIQQAGTRMAATLGKESYTIQGEKNYHTFPEFQDIKTRIKSHIWQRLVNQAGVYNICSVKQREEIEKQLYKEPEKLPDITVEGIFSWLQNFAGSADKLFNDAVREIFDWLRPRDGYWKDKYKTNEQNKYVIGEKVILTWMFRCDKWDTYAQLRYDSQKYLIAMENVFKMADGKGCVKDDNIVIKIREVQAKQSEFETEYFRLKWFKKGTLHIEFRRLDLVDKINSIAGGMNLAA